MLLLSPWGAIAPFLCSHSYTIQMCENHPQREHCFLKIKVRFFCASPLPLLIGYRMAETQLGDGIRSHFQGQWL
jgi:hypothetical protein